MHMYVCSNDSSEYMYERLYIPFTNYIEYTCADDTPAVVIRCPVRTMPSTDVLSCPVRMKLYARVRMFRADDIKRTCADDTLRLLFSSLYG